MFDTRIADAEGHRARVTPQGDIVSVISQNPPIGGDILTIPFGDFLTLDGVLNGTSALNINASTTNREAVISARNDGDVYVTTINVLISDNTLALNRFGGIVGGLINGLQFFYESPLGRATLPLSIKTNFDMIRLAQLTAPIGTKTDAFQLTNAGAESEDAYNPIIDLTRFGSQGYGIRLRKGTKDKLGFTLKDNLTGLTVFNMLAIGFTRVIKNENQD